MDCLSEELGIHKKYLKATNREDQFTALVEKVWLKALLKHSRLLETNTKCKVDSWPYKTSDLMDQGWSKVFIRLFMKSDTKVIPLPKASTISSSSKALLIPQLLQYVSQTNYKNLWKETYKKYNCLESSNRLSQVTLIDRNEAMREVISRTYGCPIINTGDSSLNVKASTAASSHSSLYPCICAVETLNAIFLIHAPYLEHSLHDCLTFSPSILEKCYAKPMFLIYQLVSCFKTLHERSLTVGEITLSDIYLDEDLWLYVFPQLKSNLHVQDVSKEELKVAGNDCRQSGHKFHQMKCVQCGLRTYDNVQVNHTGQFNLERLCDLWIHGDISNYTYLMALNAVSGRRFGDPNCHYVFPWVTDFESRSGKNWRDLKKSKFRLNKGDRQLDLTYEHAGLQVPHHVSDVLSAITYYVYMSRRTPKEVLCKNVRPNWVPAEYPVSIQRLQDWTPDECIPEFFSDPTIFKSIHDDLDDLDVPVWCSSPEDFIEKHREALESQHVSERLHHWIDLTFGYKLSGLAAVKSKNVCLHLVDGHTNLTSSGVVQVFVHPHPPKLVRLPFWGKTPPKLFWQSAPKRTRDQSTSSMSMETSRSEDDLEDMSLGLNKPLLSRKLYARSRSSLNEDKDRSSSGQRSTSVGPKNPSFTSHVPSDSDCIVLPKEFNPGQALSNLESMQMFFAKTFHTEEGKKFFGNQICPSSPSSSLVEITYPKDLKEPKESNLKEVQNAFTNHVFLQTNSNRASKFALLNSRIRGRSSSKTIEHQVSCNYEEIITSRRVREMQILGCLIVEIFMHSQLRSIDCPSTLRHSKHPFQSRLKRCLTVLNTNDIPPCIRFLVKCLLKPQESSQYNLDDFKYLSVDAWGLPPPTAHLLFEPLIHSIIPFNDHFPKLHSIVSDLKQFEAVDQELHILYYFTCNGDMCEAYESKERTKVLLMQNIAECKVKACVKKVEELIRTIDPNKDLEIVNVLMLHIKKLIEDPASAVLSAWFLFDPIAKTLGPANCTKSLLKSVLKLYENEGGDVRFNAKIAKLYHHSFLLRLIVRFGMKVFLDHFITPLVEAVGGYRDNDLEDSMLHSHQNEKLIRKTSNLKNLECESQQQSGHESSPSEESSESEAKATDEIFHFDSDDILNQLQSNISSDLPFNHSTAEEAFDTLNETIIVEPESGGRVLSPSIEIPKRKECFEKTEDAQIEDTDCRKRFDSLRKQTLISSMSADSVIWLSHRLGPVLTARYLSRNLLKMLSLCYVGKENLTAARMDGPDFISIACGHVLGDNNAAKVLECLASIAALYGHQLILYQYLPHMSELIALCKRKLTPTLEGGLISCLALLKYMVPYISDKTLMENLQDVILKNIMYPTIRLLGSTKYTFPNGSIARNILARKYIDTLYVLSLRMGATMTKDNLAVPALQRFFLIFDKISEDGYFASHNLIKQSSKDEELEGSSYIEVRRDGTIAEWNIGGRPVQISHVRLRDSDSTESLSPPTVKEKLDDPLNGALIELQLVFTPDLAHSAYKPFLKQIGLPAMESSLKNHLKIFRLYEECEQEMKKSRKNVTQELGKQESCKTPTSSSIGSNVALIGNRIDVQEDDQKDLDVLNYLSNKIENTVRHLRGNWLAYWEHEIGRADKDNVFNFKQIKLQTFTGHTNSVKCLHVLDNENSFLSGSKDKTVKLWSLRSQGDGTNVTQCQSTFASHKRGVFAICFLESARLVASCDGAVHLWDPFMGASVGQLESPKLAPISVLKGVPAPSNLLFAASIECTLKVIDARILNYVHDLKVSVSPGVSIRCVALSPLGVWVAVGLCSGYITVLDTRTGLVVSSWRAHDNEIIQLIPANEDTLISSGLDQSVNVWNVHDGKFKFCMKGTTEPVHCLQVYNDQVISGTTGNRIGVHTALDADSSFSSTKLRSDAFKGALTSMSILPLNRLLLLGADSGNVHLLC